MKENLQQRTEKNGPLVSVIMGVYNCETTVEDSINSILNQSFNDFEFIICDDASYDKTLEIALKCAQKDTRIRVLRNQVNSGLAPTLNKCIEHARGTYLARMDGDDISKKDRFQKQVDFLETHNDYAFCGTSAELFDDEGVWGLRTCIENPKAKDFLSVSPFIHPSVLFRKSALITAGLYKTKNVGRSEDYELFMRLYAQGFRGYNFQDFLLTYREDKNGFVKRKVKYLCTEAKIRYRGFKALHLFPRALPYVMRPIVLALLPARFRTFLHKSKYKIGERQSKS
ncbi:glycosyltransferase family 2 protein [Treponema sp. HNW]|uniref:glycosyltransferase family 2 protein n=1 Tax=Treponema sp. HNW TaxID=3116654 RepID=UPI003D0B432A